MGLLPHNTQGQAEGHSEHEVSLGFGLNFISGRGLLATRNRAVGPLNIKYLELEIPDIAFPFDVTGGADRFKTRHCILRHLVLGLDGDGLNRILAAVDRETSGFVELRAAMRDGFIEIGGRFAIGEHQADFTMRAALMIRSAIELSVIFFDERIYGWLPVPAALLPEYLRRALGWPHLRGGRASCWTIQPVASLLRDLMPRHGWKIPDLRRAVLTSAETARGQLVIAAGPTGEPTPKQVIEQTPPPEALRAAEGVATAVHAEELLAEGSITDAYELYREAFDDERGGRWVRERLLQIGASDPQLSFEARQLAEDILREDAFNVQALLALGALAMRDESWAEAATRYERLAEIVRQRRERYDAVAAELAAAAAATPVDSAGALAAYERAAARARDSVVAHRALMELRQKQGDWPGAVQAGERLVRLIEDASGRAEIHRALGYLYRRTGDLRRARLQFERALRLVSDDPAALEGLAETYAARGEPTRAASYLSRLAEQAEDSGDESQIIALNLRLAEIWERWLGDYENAVARYRRVLDVDPKNRSARLRLAKMAEARGDAQQARALYEDILSIEEERGDPEAVSDLVAAYTRLAQVVLLQDGPSAEAVACLERAIELEPADRTARRELARVLKERGEWTRLIRVLEGTARTATSKEEAKSSRIAAARLELDKRGDRDAALEHLQLVLDVDADDPEALSLAVPIYESRGENEQLAGRWSAAAGATTEPTRRAEHLLRLARVLRAGGVESDAERRALEQALEANPFLLNAAQRLVEVLEEQDNPHGLVRALESLALASPADEQAAEIHLRRGMLLWKELHRPEEAERSLRESLRLSPARVDCWQSLARLHRDQNDLEKARAALESALAARESLGGSTVPLHLELAELAAEAGDATQEVLHLRAGIEGGDRSIEHCDRLTALLSERGQQSEAAALLEQMAADVEEELSDLLMLRAARLHATGDALERTIEIYRSLVSRRGSAAADAARALAQLAQERGEAADEREALLVLVDLAGEDELPGLLSRLLTVHHALGDDEAIESTARSLIRHDPHALQAHADLARLAEQRASWEEALEHYREILFESPRDQQARPLRRHCYTRASSIARELRSELIAELEKGFEEEFPEATPDALRQMLGVELENSERWDALIELRKEQIERAPEQATPFRRQVADILYLQLSKASEAIPYYRDVVAAEPQDLDARQALVSIFESLGLDAELAEHLFALSHFAKDPAEALEYGLRSADIYIDTLHDEVTAAQVLRTLVDIASDPSVDASRYVQALHRFELYPQLVQYLERRVEENPDPDDPQFGELVQTVSARLGDPDWAAGWCRRMIEAFPQSDSPRRLLVDLLREYPQAGELRQALRDWADAREGARRSELIMELAAAVRREGDEDAALAILTDAAEAESDAAPIMMQLVERYRSLGDWEQVVAWQERLALATESGEQREERFRELFRLATEMVEAPEVAANALRRLEEPTEDEQRQLLSLYIRLEQAESLAECATTAHLLNAEQALAAARALVDAGDLEAARPFFEQALQSGGGSEAWQLLANAFRDSNRLGDLGRWRLAHAERLSGARAADHRLLGWYELHLADELESLTREGLLSTLEDSERGDADVCWAAFQLSSLIDEPAWLDLLARELEDSLDEEDPRAEQVLVHRVVQELERGDANVAAELARDLVQRGHEQAQQWLEEALERVGGTEELTELLTARAERGDGDVDALWSRIAVLQASAERWPAAAAALERVGEQARNRDWADLALRVAELVGDASLEAAAAGYLSGQADTEEDRARWLRRRAHLLWWRLDEEADARELLQRAQELSPIDIDACLERVHGVRGDDPAGALEQVEEALVAVGTDAPGRLLLTRAELLFEVGRDGLVLETLREARDRLDKDATGWRRLADLAERSNAIDLALDALEKAFQLDESHEEALAESLRKVERWDRLVDLLQGRAEKMHGADAAGRWSRAADIAREKLQDDARALTFMEEAARAEPTQESLRRAFDLALELGRHSVVAGMAPALLKRLDADDEERPAVLHSLVAALTHLGLDSETIAPLEQLCERGQATVEEMRLLASLLRDGEPRRAAELLERSADADGEIREPNVLFEAVRAYLDAGDDSAARNGLDAALSAGLDLVEAHKLALELLRDEPWTTSAARLLELGEDGTLADDVRSLMRCRVAAVRLQHEDAQGAYHLLLDAGELGRAEGWEALMEQALRRLDKSVELADFFVRGASEGAWQDDGSIARLREAAETYRSSGDSGGELRALTALKALVPEDVEIRERLLAITSELGDLDQFLHQAEQELNAADSPEDANQKALELAAVLNQRFVNHDAALTLLRPRFEAHPSVEILLCIADTLAEKGEAGEGARKIIEGLGLIEAGRHAELLTHAAELAKRRGGDESTEYRAQQLLLEIDPDNDDALQACLQHSLQNELWQDAVEWLAHDARRSNDPEDAAASLMRAASLVREQLEDDDRELALIEEAAELAPECPSVVTPLLHKLISRNDLDGSVGLILGGCVEPDEELDLAVRIAELLRASERNEEAEQVMRFVASRHPDSEAAHEIRLKEARVRGDAATILEELELRLEDWEVLPDPHRYGLAAEAAMAALQLERLDQAAHYVQLTLEAPTVHADWLLLAARVAERREDDEQLDAVLQLAAQMLDDIASRAQAADPHEQIDWLVLLGRAHEVAGDSAHAITAYESALDAAPSGLPAEPSAALERLYEKRGDWRRLLELHERQVEAAEDDEVRAEIYYRMAAIWQERLIDEERAGDCFARSLQAKPAHAPAQLAYGMLLYGRNQFDQALPLLQAQVDVASEETSPTNLEALAEAFRQTQHFDEAMDVFERILEREPRRYDLLATRAEMLESLERSEEAEKEWLRYIDALGGTASDDQIADVRRHLAHMARARDDSAAAIEHFEAAHHAKPEAMDVVVALRELYESEERWERAAELRQREAIAAVTGDERVAHYRTLASLYLEKLQQPERAAAMLERASEARPGDIQLLEELLHLHQEHGNWRQYLVVGERLFVLREDVFSNKRFLLAMARAYYQAAEDNERAKELFEQALKSWPGDSEVEAAYAEFAVQSGDPSVAARLEREAIERLDDEDERIERSRRLAETMVHELRDPAGAVALLEDAFERRPQDPELLRQLANTVALDREQYVRAAELYVKLLQLNPLDAAALRVLARLYGQLGDTDKAYGFYAALLVLHPLDDEAKHFVQACRPAVPSGPQRPLNDNDRLQGLIHPDQSGAFEELFASLARFAELAIPGDLSFSGVSERDRLAPADPQLEWIRKVLEPLGASEVALYLWRGGGFACGLELVNPPAILLGSSLVSDATDRQRAFMVARQAELYRSGHALCDKLDSAALSALAAALCLAVDDEASPPGVTPQTERWRRVVAAPMTDAIRESLRSLVSAYTADSDSIDVEKWRLGSLLTANRTALLASCDVEEAIDAMMRWRGIDPDDAERAEVISNTPELLDLMRFACTETFFNLRKSVGLALRSARSSG